MIVGIVAAAEAVFYLLAVPVHLALCLGGAEGLRFGAGVSAFERRAARRRAMENLGKRRAGRQSSPGVRRAWAFARSLRLERVSLRGSVCLGDAAATAMACGVLNALACGLRGRAARLEADVRPDFSSPDVRVELSGMVSARAGQIMLAAAKTAYHDIKGRIHPWTSIRSKAS